ncbi:MAG: replication initiator protein A [Gammaproteobacteria bacterium]|nr:replication initiator protein A [Gammaproteobacteria bacterium]MBL4890249.1 replication initiator protein A [Rhizobiaceae bacterium]
MQDSQNPIPIVQDDLFIADIIDVAPKSDMGSMEHPIFSLSKNRDLETFRYEYPNLSAWVEVIPSTQGRATIFDKDLLLYCIGQVVEGMNRGREVSRRIQITAYEFFMTTGRSSGGDQYKRLHETLGRLRGTTIKTNVNTKGAADKTSRRGEVFGLIDDAKVVEHNGKSVGVEITLSERIFNAISEKHVLTYSRAYFRLTSANDRRLYEICRKHCGDQPIWEIKLENLFAKFGSRSKLKEFRRMIKKIVLNQSIPDYFIDLEVNGKSEKLVVMLDKNGELKELTAKEAGTAAA